MNASPKTLLSELQSPGLVTRTVPDTVRLAALPRHLQHGPWYIGLLLGASGWLAGLLVLAFVALLFSPPTVAKAAVAGAALLGAAWALFKADRDGAFAAQLGLALSIAGQCLVLFAINEHTRGIGPVAVRAVLLQVVLALLMPNPLQRTLSAFFATIAWALTVRFALIGVPGLGWGGRGAASLGASLDTSLGASFGVWALTWLPVGAVTVVLIRFEPAWMARGWQPLARPVLTGLIVGLAFASVASQPLDLFRQSGLALWPVLSTLSALAALGAIAAAFALGNRALMGACALAVLLHVSHVYYALGVSLLLKSALMLLMGSAMLMAAPLLARGERA